MPSPKRSASFPISGNNSTSLPSEELNPPPPEPLSTFTTSSPLLPTSPTHPPNWQGHDDPYPFFSSAFESPPPYPPYDQYPPQTSLQEPPSTPKTRINGFLLILMILFLLVFFPLYFLYAAASYFFFGNNVFNDNNNNNNPVYPPDDGPSGLYQKAQELSRTARREVMIVSAIWGRLLFISLIWLVPTLSVPILRHKTLLGSKLWQWTLLFMLVACGYPFVSVATKLLLIMCLSDEFKAKKNALYFARGLRRSVNLIVLSGSALVVWVCHFRKPRDLYPGLDTATWTFVSLFVGALMGLVKTALLLNWEADAVYRRFSERITRVGFQLYFVGLIYGRRFDEFGPRKGSQVPQNDEDLREGDDLHNDVQDPERNSEHQQDDHEGDDPQDDVQFQEPQPSSTTFEPEANYTANVAMPMSTSTASHVWRAKQAARQYSSSTPAPTWPYYVANNVARQYPSSASAPTRPYYGANNAVRQPPSSVPAPIEPYYGAHIAVPMGSATSQAWGGRVNSTLEADMYTKEREEKKRLAKEVLLSKRRKASKEATTYDIKQKAKYFVNLYVLSSREGDGFSDLLSMFSDKIPNDLEHITKEDLMNQFEFDVEDANLLFSDELQVEDSTVSYETFKKWMLKAHKNCIILGYTLSDAKGVVNVLNKVMTGFLIIVVIVTWLLVAQIATTNLIVLIASPFLAAAFVFGETCRRIFEGIVFSFINHPFDVGDRCIIEGIELEVKHMGVLTTTFIKIGTREEALYPNSVLATKSITNLKGEPDPEDIVELTLDSNSTNKSALDALQSKIIRFLEDDPRFEHENSGIVIKGIGNSINMTIHYGHVLSIQEVTHTQCFEKKAKQRSQLLLQIKHIFDELDIKVATINL